MRRVILMLALAILASTTQGGIGQVYNADISVTQANTATTFTDNGSGGDGTAFAAKSVLIRSLSTSANTCYFDLKDGTATASDVALEPGGSISLTFPSTSGGQVEGWPGMGSICAAGQTATFRVTAMR